MLDSAIDSAASVIAEDGVAKGNPVYITERLKDPGSWRRLLAVKDGEQPTVFVIGAVPVAQLVRIDDECTMGGTIKASELYWRAFLAGVRDIENGPVNGDGKVPKVTIDGVEYVDPGWLRRTFTRNLHRVALEVGQCVYHWQQVTEDETKN